MFIVEDGTGLSNANSLGSVEEADEYFALVGNTEWSGTNTEKQHWLITATRFMGGLNLLGARTSTTQALDWPRTGVLIPNGSSWWQLASNQVPVEVKAGLFEYALLAKKKLLNPTVKRGKKRVKLEGIDITYDDAPDPFAGLRYASGKFALYMTPSAGFSGARLVRT